MADRHGRDFLGTYDLFADALLLFERDVYDLVIEPVRCSGLDHAKLPRLLPKAELAKLREDIPLLLRIKTAGGHSAGRPSGHKYAGRENQSVA